MKVGDKVKVLSSHYSMFEEGGEYTIGYIDGRPYGVFLIDPFYDGVEESTVGWPFHRDELEK